MAVSRPGAALAPFVAAAALALPGLGRAQVTTTVPAVPSTALATLLADAKPPATPADRPVGPKPARARAAASVRPAQAVAEPGVLHVDLSTDGPGAKSLNLPYGKSAVVDLPADVRDVLVTNPAVADAVLRSRRRISVLGVSPGDTDAVFFDDAGKRMLTLDIHVAKDSSGLADAITRLLPGSKVRVEAVNETLVLAGEVPSSSDADKARRLAERFVSKPEQVVSLLTVTGREQVMLKVRVVEVQRTIIKQLGFNMNAVTGQLGMPQYSLGNSPTFGVNNGFLGAGKAGYGLDTTSQPLGNNPFTSIATGGAGALAQAAGVNPSNLSTIVGGYLSGAGALSAAETAFSQSFLSGLIGQVSTQVTPNLPSPTTPGGVIAGPPYTATAASVGINATNIAQYEQVYLNGGASLTQDQMLWLKQFNSQLPSFYNSQGAANTSSTFIDRSNPANPVGRGLAGSTGLNSAQAMLQAFERVGLVRTLAEPNLTAVTGESAKFLAGGEFPVPTGEDNTGKVTLEFKPYGVGLAFTPVVMSEGRISLKISTEVSELSSDGAFTLNAGSNGQSLVIPALKLRRTETTVELPSGGAMMISGLLLQQTKQDIDSMPGLANLPILGALFRSRDYLSGETELAIIITPYLVKPTSPDQLQTPIDGLQIADDMSTDLMGKINKTSKAAPEAAAGKSLQGPYGYVIE